MAEELADVVIYCLGLFEILEKDAQEEVLKKVKKNENGVYEKISREGWSVKEIK